MNLSKKIKQFANQFLLPVIVVTFLAASTSAYAAANITIIGNERVDEATITSYINVQGIVKGSKSAIQDSLEKLYASELFLESKIYQKKRDWIVEVKENPVVFEVKFVGNNKIDDDALKNEATLKKRSVFTKSKLQNDIKRINEIYLKSGRFLTKIDPKIIQKERNRIEVIFDIKEGPKAKIDDIYFVGNEAYSDSKLKEEITTQVSKWWKFLSSFDVYDSDRIEFDKEKLRRFYGSKGYADFYAISATAQITPTKDRFYITFLLEEGIKYDIGDITITNDVEKFDEDVLRQHILIKKGKTYNSDLIEKTVEKMVNQMSKQSFAFAHIEPVLTRNQEQKIIDVNFVIKETPPIYINEITITGNTRTIDKVVRRELRVREGDPYNITKINRSKQRLENLGYFEKVEFETNRIDNSDKVNLAVKLKEKKTGELSLGVGYSTVDRLTTNVGIRENNLFGTGQKLGFSVQKSFASFSGEVNYTRPYFLDRNIDVGFDIFKYELSKRNTLVYDQNSDGLTVRGGYAITEYLTHQLRYSLSSQEVSNVDSDVSIAIRNLEGSFVSSGIGHTLLYDKRNNSRQPTSGYYLSFSQDYTGIGGDIKTMKYTGSAGYYIPTFSEEFILKFLARGGLIDGLGQDVRSNYGFYLGGNTFRGFRFAGLGPRYVENGSADGGSAAGGTTYYVGTVEFMFPLGLPKELGINGVLFSDNGTLKGVDQINVGSSQVEDSGSLRSTYGFSLVWTSPMGPIRLDFSKIAKREDYDETQNFRFSFGTNF
ncbi:MAG: outer membrane protein assembly factor BamA [Rickettsiales bacterium]|nr:outer membrane protein assembly factor BamA [Rickettsiales bacterium]